MKAGIFLFIAILLSVSNQLNGQNRTLYAHVIDEDLESLPSEIYIKLKDTSLVVKTDMDGKFKIKIPQNTQKLVFYNVGFEGADIKLNGNCDTVEVVMMYSGTYDFMSSRKIDKLRLARFNKLPELYLQAFKKGVFTKESPCYSREFEPEKPRLDEIEKEEIKKEKQIKLIFKKLTIGDTVRIPFSGSYRADGTDRTMLYYYSVFANQKNYDCVIKCIIIGKNTHKRHYNIICKAIDCEACKYPSVFNGKLMEAGLIFPYNMKFFKILDE